jgi:hypothetical protein
MFQGQSVRIYLCIFWGIHTYIDNRVILKFCADDDNDEFFLDRERNKLIAFQSPYIRPLLDVPATDYRGRPFIVLECMDVSVSDMLQGRRYPPLKAVVTSVLEALKVIHAGNHVHTGI